MKRKTIALMTAFTLVMSLSACGDKTPVSTEMTDTTSVEETEEVTEEAEETTVPEETEEDIKQKEIEKVQSALGEMPYYGDTANCKMTAEQATAFAQLIADGLAGDFSFRGGYDEWYGVTSWNDTLQVYLTGFDDDYYEVDRFNVMLCDFSYDGVPYLYVYSSDISKNNDLQSFEIYGWKNDIAELVCDTHSSGSSIAWETYDLYEDENDQIKLLFNTGFGIGEKCILYSFSDGTMDESYSQQAFWDGDVTVTENGVETGVYTQEEYYAEHEVLKDVQDLMENHTHTQPYTCFYDMQPCTLEEMVNYLNAYASVMSDGQSVPVEVKKLDIVKYEGTSITTKGEVPQWKVNGLEVLRQFMNGKEIGVDYSIYAYKGESGNDTTVDPDGFYYKLVDLNNDGNQELLVSYNNIYTDIFLPATSVEELGGFSFSGLNSEKGTYLRIYGSAYSQAQLYVYDGTAFSLISALNEDCYMWTENGVTQELSGDEFFALYNDWQNQHTNFSVNTHLDIENIENTFGVKINIQNSGEWLVTDAE